MLRSRALLQKAAAEASKVAKDAVKAAAVEAAADTKKVSSSNSAPPPPPPPDTNSSSTSPLLLYHHTDMTLLENRRPGSASYLFHHLSSAMGAVISLCTSQESRDEFLRLTGPNNDAADEEDEYYGPIINTTVIGQSDMGFLKPLTLFEELDDPLYGRNPEFNVYEFMNGCGWALQQFHITKDSLISKMPKITPEKLSSSMKSIGGETKGLSLNLNVVLDDIEAAAREDPNSIESSFLAMTTNEMVTNIFSEEMLKAVLRSEELPANLTLNNGADPAARKLLANNFKVIEEDTKVNNVALLSARVEEIYPPASLSISSDEVQKVVNDPHAPLEDDSLLPDRSHALKSGEDKPQVVAQLEVLYELQQSGTNEDDGDGKVHTQTGVMVGKFEACLDGNPNVEEDGLRWRIASYRPAVEFYHTF